MNVKKTFSIVACYIRWHIYTWSEIWNPKEAMKWKASGKKREKRANMKIKMTGQFIRYLSPHCILSHYEHSIFIHCFALLTKKKKIFCGTPLYILWESSWKLKIEIEKPTSNLVDRKFKILYNAFKISFLLVLETSSSDFTAWQERKKAFCICVADEMTLWVRRGDDENGRRTW